jgi:hypothetical protein
VTCGVADEAQVATMAERAAPIFGRLGRANAIGVGLLVEGGVTVHCALADGRTHTAAR